MAFRLYDLPEIEPSRSVGFSGNRIDRQSEKRQDDSAFTALELPETRIMLLGGNRLLLDYADEKAPRALFRLGEAKEFAADLQEPILLGLQDGVPIVALTTPLDPETMEAPFRLQDYRSIYTEGLVSADLPGALAQAAALTAWHTIIDTAGAAAQKPTCVPAGPSGNARTVAPNIFHAPIR